MAGEGCGAGDCRLRMVLMWAESLVMFDAWEQEAAVNPALQQLSEQL